MVISPLRCQIPALFILASHNWHWTGCRPSSSLWKRHQVHQDLETFSDNHILYLISTALSFSVLSVSTVLLHFAIHGEMFSAMKIYNHIKRLYTLKEKGTNTEHCKTRKVTQRKMRILMGRWGHLFMHVAHPTSEEQRHAYTPLISHYCMHMHYYTTIIYIIALNSSHTYTQTFQPHMLKHC